MASAQQTFIQGVTIEKTITIIQTIEGCIFGGYTDKAWSSAGEYIKDDNAIIFSLKNKDGYNCKIMKCLDAANAIYCHPGKGPIFGIGQHLGGHDLCIRSGSDVQLNYSNLGRSYSCPGFAHPRGALSTSCQSYLAGSYNFIVKEIEVYRKI